ncbi:MAG: phosphoserine transaminase [Actinomycetia bacterium]|nr:phosphoserine transaminase [Actinomycetes bacterium]MCH9801315.1 phosphoserine transaminase [Actinomycetes bacterium]
MAAADVNVDIPQELLPADGRFGAGPSKVRAEQVEALQAAAPDLLGTSHRQKAVKSQVGRTREGLKELYGLPDDYEVVLGNGGSTAFWEIAVFGLIKDRSQFCSFGEFGSKFAKSAAAAPFLGEVDLRTSEPGTAPEFEPQPGIDVYATPHNETSTGVAITPTRVAQEGALTLFDATSAAAGLAVSATDFDVYYFAPQKGFASEGGMWFALMSPAALERAREIKASDRYIPPFLDLVTAMDNSAKDQTYNTPSVSTLFLMAEQLDWFNSQGGLDWCVARTADSAGRLYGWAEANPLTSPYVSDPALRSNVVGTIDFAESVDAAALAATLRANGILDTEPYRKLGRNQLRISMYPAVEPEDVTALTQSIDYVLQQWGA